MQFDTYINKYQIPTVEAIGVHIRFTELIEMKRLNLLPRIMNIICKIAKDEKNKYFIAYDNDFFYKKYAIDFLSKNKNIYI